MKYVWALVASGDAYCSRLNPRAGREHLAIQLSSSSLTFSQSRLPCPPCGKMGLQSWTMVVTIN